MCFMYLSLLLVFITSYVCYYGVGVLFIIFYRFFYTVVVVLAYMLLLYMHLYSLLLYLLLCCSFICCNCGLCVCMYVISLLSYLCLLFLYIYIYICVVMITFCLFNNACLSFVTHITCRFHCVLYIYFHTLLCFATPAQGRCRSISS